MNKNLYVCNNCGWESIGWIGKCGGCGNWGTLQLQEGESLTISKSSGKEIIDSSISISSLKDIDISSEKRMSSGFKEFDTVLGGGFVAGSAVLLSGLPGVGKSTLALEVLVNIASSGSQVLYISSEESIQQVSRRFNRVAVQTKSEELIVKNIILVEGKEFKKVIAKIKEINPVIIVWDSLQSFYMSEVGGVFGGITQIKSICNEIIKYTRKNKTISIIIGQVNKEGVIAGPMVVEHMVDALFTIESVKDSTLRLVRTQKNRFGSTMEVGVFEMEEDGMRDYSDSTFKMLDQNVEVGVANTVLLEGNRVFPIEVQALVVPSVYSMPKRTAQGILRSKVEMLIAIMSKVMKIQLSNKDVFINVSGGFNVKEPTVDLAIVASILSSIKNIPLPVSSVYCGEVSLSGVVVAPSMLEKRVSFCEKLGFSKFFANSNEKVKGKIFERVERIINLHVGG
ncbi:MAG TPA: ATPase domain-containing protein [Candidatus Dojkabacteria bacterium]|nr:ATPase domain-containing protein [Candidatus Dojkabacteria bacterium]